MLTCSFTFKRLKDQYAKSPAAAATAAANGGGGAAAAAALDAASVVWCVTAPAMWGEAAKERLRRAADRAGAWGNALDWEAFSRRAAGVMRPAYCRTSC